MPGIRTNAAAEVLGVSPNTLRSWERRYGYPKPKRTEGNHRNYELVELQALRDALAETGNISSAIELARQRQEAPANDGSLFAAFESFDETAADRAVEESLAMRSLERTVEELLLPAIDKLAADPEREAELEFAARWATGWLHGARRLASAAARPAGILLLDSSHGQDAEEVYTQALDLALRRAGFRVLVLSNELGDERLDRALGALDPTAIILCRHPERRQAGPPHPRPRLRRPALRLPRRRPDRRRRPTGRQPPQRGHGDAQLRPPSPSCSGIRLSS
jgi:DNA-binding transcriptional MerR regulator